MGSALVSGWCVLRSNPGWGHCCKDGERMKKKSFFFFPVNAFILSWLQWENLKMWRKIEKKKSRLYISPSFVSSPFILSVWLFRIRMRLGSSLRPSIYVLHWSSSQPISLHLLLSLSTEGNHRSLLHAKQTCTGWG